MKAIAALLAFLFCVRPAAAVEYASFTPLIEAVQNKNVSPYAIEAMILDGARVNERDNEGRTVLMLAAKYHPDPLVHYLLIQGGADINARTPDTGKTALFFAVQFNPNPDEVVPALLNYGADQHIEDVFGCKAYHYAEKNRNFKSPSVLWLFADHAEDDWDE